MPAPPGQRSNAPWYTPALGLADMGAATLRGVVRGTLGLPGDLESLVRLGIGGKQQMRTSEDWDKHLPPLFPDKPDTRSPYDDLGVFYNLPVYGGALKAGSKGIMKLGGKMVGGDTNLGRREFAKKAGALALGGTALAKAVKYLEDIAPVAKQADEIPKEWGKVETAVGDGAKVASKHKFNSLKEYNDYLNKTAEEEAISINRAMGYNNTAKPHEMASHRNIKSELARNDESIYNAAKNYDKYGDAIYDESMKWDPYDQEMFKASKEAFSPQAKAEMKAFKNLNESVAHRHYEEMVEKGRQSLGSYYRKPPYEDYQRMIYNQNSRWVDYLDDYVKNPKIFDNISY